MPSDAPDSAPAPAPAPPAARTVNHVPWWIYPVLAPFALLMRLWLMSLRFHTPADALAKIDGHRGPLIVCFWHNRLLLAPELRRRYRAHHPIHGLISASKDGAWLVAFFNLMGVRAVRGSSSWRGGQATVELEARLKQGHDVGLTPDGPRGPIYEFKKGPAVLALRRRVPVLLIGSDFSHAKVLDSWDRLRIPLPFSRVDFRVDIVPPEPRWDALTPETFAAELRERLMAVTSTVPLDAVPRGKSK